MIFDIFYFTRKQNFHYFHDLQNQLRNKVRSNYFPFLIRFVILGVVLDIVFIN